MVRRVAFGGAVKLGQQLETLIDLTPNGESIHHFILLALDELIPDFGVDCDGSQFSTHLNRQKLFSALLDQPTTC